MNKTFDFILKFMGICLRRLFIVAFYVAVLLAFLYSPRVFDYFITDEKSITVYTFTEFISPDSLREFEAKTGIKVRLQYFESNEELYAKFKINQGEGYDLITPSDYMVEIMYKNNMLKSIDQAKLSNFKELDPHLLNKFFDPGNKYSIPVCWLVYGLAYNSSIIGPKFTGANLELLFKDPKRLALDGIVTQPYKICMLQDSREMVYLAAIYLFGRTSELAEEELVQIQDLLSKQKNWVESYTTVGVPYFLMGNIASVAVITSHQVKKMLEITDKFIFEVPTEGSILAIENLAIPGKTKKADLVHKFIDFLISEKVSSMHASMYGTNPSNQKAYVSIDKKFTQNPNFFPTDKIFDKLHLVRNEMPLERVDSIWLAVRFY